MKADEARKRLEAEARQAFAASLLRPDSSKKVRPEVEELVRRYGPAIDALVDFLAPAGSTVVGLLMVMSEDEAFWQWPEANTYLPIPDVKALAAHAPSALSRVRQAAPLLERLATELRIPFAPTGALRGRENLVPLAQLVILRGELDWSLPALDLVAELDVVPAVTVLLDGSGVRYGRPLSGKTRAAADKLVSGRMPAPPAERRAKSGRRKQDFRGKEAASRREIVLRWLPRIRSGEVKIKQLAAPVAAPKSPARAFKDELRGAGVKRVSLAQLYRDVKFLSH